MAFLGSVLQYTITALVMIGVAILGIFAGKKLRDRKDAKKAAAAAAESQAEN